MKYNIGDTLFFEKDKTTKKIIDFEKFGSITIYYMDDVTSYSEDQLYDLINPKINKYNLKERDFFKLIEDHAEEIQKEYDRLMEKIINSSN